MTTIFREKAKGGYDWIDVSQPTKTELNELAGRYGLHPAIVEDCLQPDHLPKFEMVEENPFVILRTFNESATNEADTIQEVTDKIAVFIGPEFILTVHRPLFPFLEKVKAEYVDNGKCPSTYHVLFRIFSFVITTYDKPLAELNRQLDIYEPKIFLQRKTPDLLKDLYFIKRRATVTENILELSRSIHESLKGKISSLQYNHLKDEFTRQQTSTKQVVDNVTNLLNMYISLSTQRTSEVMRVLTVFSVFFMPLTFIVGIYGMNFDFMPELRWEFGYLYTVFVMVGVTLSIYLWFRRKGWM